MNPGSIRREADEMVSAFRVQFSIAASDKIGLADLLASTKPNKGGLSPTTSPGGEISAFGVSDRLHNLKLLTCC